MKNIKKPFLVYVLTTAIFVVFQFYKYDLYIIAHGISFGLQIALGLFDNFINATYLVLIVYSMFYAIRKFTAKKGKAFMPLVVCIIVVSFLFIFPSTNLYLEWNYRNYRQDRLNTIEMIENGEISNYRIDNNEYMAPFKTISYTKTILTQKHGDVLKTLFHTYRGRSKSKIIVYVSDDSGISEYDFGFGIYDHKNVFSNISRISPNWYTATMEN